MDGDGSSWADTYSDASQAFLLRDFRKADETVETLVQQAQQHPSNADTDIESVEIVRKVWILKVTLVASRDDTASQGPAEKEKELVDVYCRLQAYYKQEDGGQRLPVHPSILVALSLAGLKLALPGFARRTLEDYFDILLCSATAEDELQDASTILDSSHADLSLSGIAGSGDQSRSQQAVTGWTKSLHRLARIYTIHLLGKTMQDWQGAREWVVQQRTEDVGIQLVTEDNAESLLDELEAAKAQQEQEAVQLRQREKDRLDSIEREKELRKAEQKGKVALKPMPDDKKSSSASSASNALSAKARDAKNSSTLSTSTSSTSRSSPTSSSERLGWQRPASAPAQDTGFAALRSHLSSFLSADRSASSLLPSSSSSPANRASTLDSVKTYLSTLLKSRLVNSLLFFLILLGFWRRRLARTGRTIELGKAWTRVKDKVLQTVKMGGSLGYL